MAQVSLAHIGVKDNAQFATIVKLLFKEPPETVISDVAVASDQPFHEPGRWRER